MRNKKTEITQNQSPTIVLSETEEDGEITIKKRAGDFVVCNLSSINLPRTAGRAGDIDLLERVIMIQVRMLDNVIDLNADKLEVLQARATNRKYRAVGLGGYGWAHLLAIRKIQWESETAVKFADQLYERIAYLTIKASADLAKEKGAYPAFEGSDWQTGEYFRQRYYAETGHYTHTTATWSELAADIAQHGIRNGYLQSPAPNMSSAKIGGSTDGIDPIFQRSYSEEKKSYKIPVVVPDLSPETFWYYKPAHRFDPETGRTIAIDQSWSVRQNAARQRHIDQSISFNLYVSSDIKAADLLALHVLAWESGLKTTYYVRSAELTIESCESCAS